tara:strand:- start:88 stop:768 length:681 start_codon:yes stop_codon:yes gene_type:complete
MNWDDEGYLLHKNRYNENSVIAEFFTKSHGKCSGIIFGATSKKLKNYLLVGNKFHISYNAKSEDKLGYFKVEIIKANTPFYFENKKKLLNIICAMYLIKILTVEYQKNIKIFDSLNDFFLILKNSDWVKNYIFWELNLLRLIGFELNLKKIAKSEIINNEKKYFVESMNEKKYIPNFLVDNDSGEVENKTLLKGLKLVGDYLEKNILIPNNLNYPYSRSEFINLFK